MLQADVMLPPLGKLRYSRRRARWLPRHEIFHLIRYLVSHLHYNCNKMFSLTLFDVNILLPILLLLHHAIALSVLPRNAMLARYNAIVCLSVRHKPVLYRISKRLDGQSWLLAWKLPPKLCYQEIQLSPKMRVRPRGISAPNSGHKKISPRQVDGVVNKTRRRLYSLWIIPITVEHVVAGRRKFITRWLNVTL